MKVIIPGSIDFHNGGVVFYRNWVINPDQGETYPTEVEFRLAQHNCMMAWVLEAIGMKKVGDGGLLQEEGLGAEEDAARVMRDMRKPPKTDS